jgi:fibronectin type 3 domain-containing protein
VTTAGTKITTAASPYVQTGLAASTTYYYIVTAVNAAGQSAASAQVSAATNAPVVTIPAAPTGVTAAGGANQVSISWSAVSGATSYNIYYATTTGVTKTSGAKITNASSPYIQTALAAGTTYYYIVTAVNSAGESAASAQASAATNAAPPVACGSCHSIPPATGLHDFHVNSRGISCVSCHGTGYSATTVNTTTHNNGVVNVVSTIGWNATTSTCASPGCHGGGRSW